MQYRLNISPDHIKQLVEIDNQGREQPIPIMIVQMAAKYCEILTQIETQIDNEINKKNIQKNEFEIELSDTLMQIVIHCKSKVLKTVERILEEVIGNGHYAATAISASSEQETEPEQSSPPAAPRPTRISSDYPFVINNAEGKGYRIHYGYKGSDLDFGD